MSKLLLNLRNVPDDEAAEVREWLTREGIGFYETQPSPWGISAGGIWIGNEDQFSRAKSLMADYQAARRQQAQASLATAREEGKAETFAGLLRQRPTYVLTVLAAILFIVGLTLALPYLFLR